jgi:hypothetical protein
MCTLLPLASAWIAYSACAVTSLALLALQPRLRPHVDDALFLATPARSLAALTLLTWVLAASHETAHWLAARASGVRARMTLARRLYFLALEIDLTGLWGLPRRRRYGPLLAGLAFDFTVLCGALLARSADVESPLTAALVYIEVAAVVSQCWVFARTDLYAVLVTASGCANLHRVTRLMARRMVGLATARDREELATAAPLDIAVARWFRFVHAGGILAAAAFFAVYYFPISLQLMTWTAASVSAAAPGSERFCEASACGAILLLPEALMLGIALRDLRRRVAARRG